MNNNLKIGYIFGILLTLFVVITILVYYYNDDVEKEYFANYLALDEMVRRM